LFHTNPYITYLLVRPTDPKPTPPTPAHILPIVRTDHRPVDIRFNLYLVPPQTTFPVLSAARCLCSIHSHSQAKQGSQSKVSGILSCRPGQPTLPSLVSHSIVILGQSFAIVQSLPSRSLQNLFQRHCIATPHQKLLYYTRNPYLTFSQFVRFPVLFRALHCLTQACTYYTALLSAQLVLYSTAVTRLQLYVTLELGLIPTAVTSISKRLTSPGSPHLTSAFRALYGTAPRPIGRCPMVHNNAR